MTETEILEDFAELGVQPRYLHSEDVILRNGTNKSLRSFRGSLQAQKHPKLADYSIKFEKAEYWLYSASVQTQTAEIFYC
jgi:hypothetical protein